MKKNLKGKLILSIATLGLAAASTVGSTFAWFIVNQSATASGVQMTANSGTGLYIRKAEGNPAEGTAHTGTFSEEAEIKGTLNNAKFEPCTSASETSGTVTPNSYTAFKPSFATLKGVKSDDTTKLEYTTITATNITSTDVYGVADTGKTLGDNTDTKAYYYNFKIDYMISTSAKDKLRIGVEKVTVYDETGTKMENIGEDEASLDKATRVAFIDAKTYGEDHTVTYADSGTEYAIATACTTDHNLNALEELGYTGDSEYDTYDKDIKVLDAETTTHTVETPTDAKTTSDGSFTYGSVDVYVWFDGTDKACTNAIFSQKVTFDLKFTIASSSN